MQTLLDRHIEIDAGIRGGKPRITGTRIAVSDVVLMHLRMGQSLEQIAGHYDVSLAALHATMAYYYDHQADINRAMQEEDAALQASRESQSSLLQAKLRTLNGG
jgi:uncharacterized protein (DUF433 family)